MITLDGVSAGYAGSAVVRNLSMVVNAGEVVGLLGPNGAGKTTTLLTISGIPVCGLVAQRFPFSSSSTSSGMSLRLP